MVLLRIIVQQGFGLRILLNFITSFFLSNELREDNLRERSYLKRILLLGFSNNFDWRHSG